MNQIWQNIIRPGFKGSRGIIYTHIDGFNHIIFSDIPVDNQGVCCPVTINIRIKWNLCWNPVCITVRKLLIFLFQNTAICILKENGKFAFRFFGNGACLKRKHQVLVPQIPCGIIFQNILQFMGKVVF